MPHAVATFAERGQVFSGVDLFDPEISFETAQKQSAEQAATLEVIVRRALWRGAKRAYRARKKLERKAR